jgi:hypothetical protein
LQTVAEECSKLRSMLAAAETRQEEAKVVLEKTGVKIAEAEASLCEVDTQLKAATQ